MSLVLDILGYLGLGLIIGIALGSLICISAALGDIADATKRLANTADYELAHRIGGAVTTIIDAEVGR